MVDEYSRKLARELLGKLLKHEIDVDQFEEEYPVSKDPAIENIMRMLWSTWDDVPNLEPLLSSGQEQVSLLERCIWFLNTDLPFTASRVENRLKWMVDRITGRSDLRDLKASDLAYWPFASAEDRDRARRHAERG